MKLTVLFNKIFKKIYNNMSFRIKNPFKDHTPSAMRSDTLYEGDKGRAVLENTKKSLDLVKRHLDKAIIFFADVSSKFNAIKGDLVVLDDAGEVDKTKIEAILIKLNNEKKSRIRHGKSYEDLKEACRITKGFPKNQRAFEENLLESGKCLGEAYNRYEKGVKIVGQQRYHPDCDRTIIELLSEITNLAAKVQKCAGVVISSIRPFTSEGLFDSPQSPTSTLSSQSSITESPGKSSIAGSSGESDLDRSFE